MSDGVLCWFVRVYFFSRHADWKFKPQGQYLLLPTGYWEDLIMYDITGTEIPGDYRMLQRVSQGVIQPGNRNKVI